MITQGTVTRHVQLTAMFLATVISKVGKTKCLFSFYDCRTQQNNSCFSFIKLQLQTHTIHMSLLDAQNNEMHHNTEDKLDFFFYYY